MRCRTFIYTPHVQWNSAGFLSSSILNPTHSVPGKLLQAYETVSAAASLGGAPRDVNNDVTGSLMATVMKTNDSVLRASMFRDWRMQNTVVCFAISDPVTSLLASRGGPPGDAAKPVSYACNNLPGTECVGFCFAVFCVHQSPNTNLVANVFSVFNFRSKLCSLLHLSSVIPLQCQRGDIW